jgi:hypothetical protein
MGAVMGLMIKKDYNELASESIKELSDSREDEIKILELKSSSDILKERNQKFKERNEAHIEAAKKFLDKKRMGEEINMGDLARAENFPKGLPIVYQDEDRDIVYEYPDGSVKKKKRHSRR